jgi:hypothetical protein
MFALQAVSLSATFGDMFGNLKIPPGYTVDMTAPEGPSTGGGAQSVQHIRLHAPDNGPTFVMGNVDQNQMKASLRSHPFVVKLAQQRSFQLTVDPRSFNALTSRVKKFLEGLHFVVTVEEAPEPVTAEVNPEALLAAQGGAVPSSRFGIGFVTGLLFGGGLGALITALLMRR